MARGNRLDNTSTITLVINGNQAQASAGAMERALRAVSRERKELNKVDDPAKYKELVKQERALAAALKERRDEIKETEEEGKGFFSSFKKGFKDISSVAAGVTIGTLIVDGLKAAGSALKDMVMAGIEAYKTFEKFDIVLTNTLGSKSASKQVLRDLSKFAAETPYELEELTGAYIKFVNRGIKPTMEDMRNMGDLASSQGKSFDQLTEAILDAVTGEFERLKEFGIRASKNGDTVKLSFKGITTEVANTDEAIKKAILSFGAMDGVAGGMEKLSKSMEGLDSNIEDNTNRVLMRIGAAAGGFIYNIKSVYNELLQVLADTRTKSEKLTDEFQQQALMVNKLEKNTVPLINRYDELKAKGELNKTEQNELKKVISQIADVIPSAVTQWDKYGNAIGINTDKAREFLRVQQQLLKYQNREAIEATKEEIAGLVRERDAILRQMNSGKTTYTISGGTVGTGTQLTRPLNDKEILSLRAQLQDFNGSIGDAQARLKGLNGDYLADLNKKVNTTVEKVKQVTEMTRKELQNYIKGLNESLDDLKPGTAAYKKIEEQVKAAEKLLNPEKALKNEETQRNKAATALAKYKNELEGLLAQANQLSAAAEKGSFGEIEAKLKVIDDKYNKIIEKAKTLMANPNASAGDKKKLSAFIDDQKSEATQARLNTGMDGYFKLGLDELNKDYDAQQNILKEKRAQDLIDDEEFNDQKQDLARQQLEEEYFLRVTYGQDTASLEEKLADHALIQKKRETDGKLKYLKEQQKSERDYLAIQKDIQAQRDQVLSNGVSLLGQLFGKSKGMILAQLAMEKAIAVGRIVAHTGVEIAGYYAAYAAIPFTGVLTATTLAAAAKVRAAWSIASIVGEGLLQGASAVSSSSGSSSDSGGSSNAASASTGTRRAKRGAMIPNGPSHEQNGIDLINNQTGERIAEMEGGEPIFIFSKDAYRNNKPLIDQLLYNSLYRNGASVNVDSLSRSVNMARSGGLFTDRPAQANSPITPKDDYTASTDVTAILQKQNELIAELGHKFDSFSKKPWEWSDRAYQEYQVKKSVNEDRATF